VDREALKLKPLTSGEIMNLKQITIFRDWYEEIRNITNEFF